MLTLPPQFTHRQYAERWNASVAAAAASKDVQQVRWRALEGACSSCCDAAPPLLPYLPGVHTPYPPACPPDPCAPHRPCSAASTSIRPCTTWRSSPTMCSKPRAAAGRSRPACCAAPWSAWCCRPRPWCAGGCVHGVLDAELGPAPPADRAFPPIRSRPLAAQFAHTPALLPPPTCRHRSTLCLTWRCSTSLCWWRPRASLQPAKEDFNFEMVRACGCMWVHVGGACLGGPPVCTSRSRWCGCSVRPQACLLLNPPHPPAHSPAHPHRPLPPTGAQRAAALPGARWARPTTLRARSLERGGTTCCRRAWWRLWTPGERRARGLLLLGG